MSAIFGLVWRDGRPAARDDLQRMDAALAGTGPDAHGLWHRGPVGLGYRLMEFTPEDRLEDQPLRSRDGVRTLVFEGRIDNRPELAAAFGLDAVEARAMPDSAFVLRAYETWGEECPHHLVGPFAFAVWDERTHALFAARAQFLAGPLHYFVNDSVLAFATRPKGLFALPFVPRAIDDEYAADFLVSVPGDHGHCFWRDVRLLERGHCLRLDSRGLTVRPYWSLDALAPVRFASDDDYVDAFSALFERVVADQLRSLTPASVMMSGGLDSTAIAAAAAMQLAQEGKELLTFTDIPGPGWEGVPVRPGRYANEAPFATAMGQRHANLRVNLARRDGFYLDDVVRLFEAAERPFRNAANRNWWEGSLRDSAAAGARVVFTGDGGNLSFSWHGEELLTQLLRAGRLGELVSAARMAVDAGTRRSLIGALARAALRTAPPFVQRPLYRSRAGVPLRQGPDPWRTYSPISPALARDTRLLERARAKGHTFDFLPPRDSRTARWRSLRQVDVGSEIARGHREMYGVDMRLPAMDRRIVEFSLSIPEEQFQHRGRSRALLRRAMAGRVPQEILDNRSRGLQAVRWLQRLHDNRPLIEDELRRFRHNPLVGHILDVPRLTRLMEELPAEHLGASHIKVTYRVLFEIGLMTGRFLRWVDEHA